MIKVFSPPAENTAGVHSRVSGLFSSRAAGHMCGKAGGEVCELHSRSSEDKLINN